MKNITDALKEQRPNDMVLIVFNEQNCAVVKSKYTNGTYSEPSICYYDLTKDKIYFVPLQLFKMTREMDDVTFYFNSETQQKEPIDNKPYKSNLQLVYDTIRQSKYSQIIDNYEFTWGVCTLSYFIKNIINKFNFSYNDLNTDEVKKLFNEKLTIEQNLNRITDPNLLIKR